MRKGIPLFIGLVLLIIGLALFEYRVSKIKAGIVADATVVRIDRKQDGDDLLYAPVLAFINYKNDSMMYKAGYSANDWYIGEKAKILYTKDHPDDISILSYWGTFGFILLFFCGALVSLFIAGGIYLGERFLKTLKNPIG